jgi:hypothetical protein
MSDDADLPGEAAYRQGRAASVRNATFASSDALSNLCGKDPEELQRSSVRRFNQAIYTCK